MLEIFICINYISLCILFRHANERRVKGIEFEERNNTEENNCEFENIPSDNDSDEGNSHY